MCLPERHDIDDIDDIDDGHHKQYIRQVGSGKKKTPPPFLQTLISTDRGSGTAVDAVTDVNISYNFISGEVNSLTTSFRINLFSSLMQTLRVTLLVGFIYRTGQQFNYGCRKCLNEPRVGLKNSLIHVHINSVFHVYLIKMFMLS